MSESIVINRDLKASEHISDLVCGFSLREDLFRFLLWSLLTMVIFFPISLVHAQDPGDEEGEIFWGDEEEDEDDDEEYDEEDEYLDDEEYYEEDDEGDEEEYDEEDEYLDDEEYYEEDDEEYDEEDDEEYEDEGDEGEEEEYDEEGDLIDDEIADEAAPMGWSVDISGSRPRLVNYTLWDQFNLQESIWAPGVDARVSIEAPYLLQMMGMRFRIGAEVGTFGFKDLSPREAELKGITAMGIVSFPAGPGKIKGGAGVIGTAPGFIFEATYGMAIGTLDMRLGIRTTEVMSATDSVERELGHLGWMDMVVVLGVNF